MKITITYNTLEVGSVSEATGGNLSVKFAPGYYTAPEVDASINAAIASIGVSGDFVQEASLGTSFYNNGTSIDVSTSIHWNGYQISVIDTSAFDSGSALGNTIYFLRL